MDRNLLIISERFQGDGSKRERCELRHTLHSSDIHCIDRYHAFPLAVRRFCVGASDANFTRLQLMCTILSIADSLTQLISRFWIEKARRKRQKKCAFLIARSYGPGLKNRLH